MPWSQILVAAPASPDYVHLDVTNYCRNSSFDKALKSVSSFTFGPYRADSYLLQSSSRPLAKVCHLTALNLLTWFQFNRWWCNWKDQGAHNVQVWWEIGARDLTQKINIAPFVHSRLCIGHHKPKTCGFLPFTCFPKEGDKVEILVQTTNSYQSWKFNGQQILHWRGSVLRTWDKIRTEEELASLISSMLWNTRLVVYFIRSWKPPMEVDNQKSRILPKTHAWGMAAFLRPFKLVWCLRLG
jgi:hypothetical protein